MDNSPDKAQNVIAMTGYQPDTGYGAIAQIEAYWEAIRGTRLLPKRSDIDPRGIDQALENAFILERIAPGIARLRIAGSHLGDLMGMEVRGMPLTAFFTPAARPAVTELLEVVFQTPAISTLRLVSPGSGARPALNARMVLLPLKSDLGDVSRVLGGFVSKGDMGTAPRRFDVVSKEVTHLLAGHAAPLAPAPTFPHPAPTVPQTRKPVGVAEDQTPYIGKSGKKRPPYLRLVKSSEDISDGS
ncbi:PAS domain-containing protein [Sulfitobacter sp. M57]|nr:MULTISPECIES: PAS domain-containing protein [unclassified Sulfitobacter]MDF3421016.1 PAS domain-containing protein [Sulfitobacter sp. KE43]MDF3432249.1 PAS domain-containing protein [Sulfitobacter sp. KE42]MDF3457888.1 PAS domain-containing protein [Sulfitobacter sp. S74]MDF3461789.1 PAS domain-containing protein [Sulfitobacter sp. Ks18]MDF3477236.1 PAS domain-containing protein [Sulfitobacter sp. M53]MDF3481135.1 PAS domain-containing protein [Sulfitobacter sp. M24]MDF3485031.1 PAS domai